MKVQLGLKQVAARRPKASSNFNLGKHRRSLSTGTVLPPSAEEETEGVQGPENINLATSCVAW